LTTLTLTENELGLLSTALRFKPFMAAISEPRVRRVLRDTYRAVVEKVRDAAKGEQEKPKPPKVD
jgi:hypothetical protein